MSILARAKNWSKPRRKVCAAFFDDLFPERKNSPMTDAQRMFIMVFYSLITVAATLIIDPPTLEDSSAWYCALSGTVRLFVCLPAAAFVLVVAWKLCCEIGSFCREVIAGQTKPETKK